MVIESLTFNAKTTVLGIAKTTVLGYTIFIDNMCWEPYLGNQCNNQKKSLHFSMMSTFLGLPLSEEESGRRLELEERCLQLEEKAQGTT
jgi:hypothetical protein